MPHTLIIISTPVAPLGYPVAGGVCSMVRTITRTSIKHFNKIIVLAPHGSQLPFQHEKIKLHTFEGQLEQHCHEGAVKQPELQNRALEKILSAAHEMAEAGDVVLNLSYDKPAYDATVSFTKAPLFHYVTMAVDEPVMKEAVTSTYQQYPHRMAFMSRRQAAFFGVQQHARILYIGLEFDRYQLQEQPQHILGWAGRISPEKNIGLAFKVAQALNMPLRVAGFVQDKKYWEETKQQFPDVKLEYVGFLETLALQKAIGECSVFLMTSSWVEAFGIVALEAMACGVPVVCYENTGAAEMIDEGITGKVIPQGNEALFVEAARISQTLNRANCRKQVEGRFSEAAFSSAFLQWISSVN